MDQVNCKRSRILQGTAMMKGGSGELIEFFLHLFNNY